MPVHRFAWILLALLGLAACASTPKFDTENVDKAITPAQAVAELDGLRGKSVLWGGTIIASHNLQNATEIEVLGYPLDSDGRPQLDRTPLGRFIARRDAYLEPVDYASGRLLTVVGPLESVRDGRVGQAPYRYPVMSAQQMALWPQSTAYRNDPQLHFGIGIGIIR